MSSMVSRIAILAALVSSTSSTAATSDAPQSNWEQVRQSINTPAPQSAQVTAAVMEWRRLNQSDGLSFNEYAAFLLANPGWPGEERMRKTAEGAINLLSYSPSNVTAYFAKYPPLSNSGWARYAVALASSARPGDMAIAQNAARQAWRGGALSVDDETRLLGLFGRTFTSTDHDMRMDALLWADATSAADRQLAYTSPGRRAVFEARLALKRKSPDARSEEHTSELQSLMRISYAVFCLKKKKKINTTNT